MRKISFIFCVLLQAVNSFAQFDVRGSVNDKNGQKIPGALVHVIGTFNGIQTDAKGEFFFKNIASNVVNTNIVSRLVSTRR